MRPFPENFDPSALEGPRGKDFPRREDAFQQLVGDGLRELRGGLGVEISTTRGRDGSIDILVEEAAGADDGCLPGLPKPLIVECKDHDEAGKDLRDALFAGWRKVAKRLSSQAEAGWQGDYAPWRRAHSYAYCVSARLSKPQLLVDLRDKIREFFDSLPSRPPLQAIQVLDWSNLRTLWDRAPHLADRWLGVGLKALLAHEEQLEHFTGFRAYLLEATLPFLAPAPDDPAHPDALLASLAEHGRERGLLLAGPGGVGKSRTLVEVAVRADAAGWRVLHAQAGEPALTDEDLEATVLSGLGPTLVVLDYVDQMQLDFDRLRRRLLPAAAVRGIQLALLANARTSWLVRKSAARDDLFEVVPLRPTGERARAIADRLLETVAPRALERLGHARLAELCGERPIVALLVAREIERRAHAGMLVEERLAGVRSGDLTGWLRRRLGEDQLLVDLPPSGLEPATPGAHLVGVAAILAAAPQPEAALAAAGERTLLAARLDPRSDPGERALYLVSLLRTMGWLEPRGSELAAAHDVVADEVVYDVLADRPAALVRGPELEALLAPALASARTLGRVAVALRRVVGTEGIDEGVAARLADASAKWLNRQAAGLGQMLAHGDADEISFALGAVVHGAPWSEAAFEAWDALIAPFLTAYAERPAARHLLYRGLSTLPEGRGGRLVPLALSWLEKNGRLREASFVFSKLFDRKDLKLDDARAGVTLGFKWLGEFGGQLTAQFVLASLLGRRDLKPDDVRAGVNLGLDWLREFGGRVEASFVLHPLLGREDLSSEEVGAGVKLGLDWLKDYKDREEAGFAIAPLLGRRDLKPDDVRAGVNLGLDWLREFGSRVEARFVLRSLLSRDDLSSEEASAGMKVALGWLREFGGRVEAGFVLDSLLGRENLEADEAQKVVASAIAWLKAEWHRAGGDFVLSALLARNDLTSDARQEAHLLAASRIRAHPREEDSSFLIKELLTQKGLSLGVAREAAAAGVLWLGENRAHAQADFVFSRLLRRDDLPAELRPQVEKLGIAWLRSSPNRNDRDYALSSLLWNVDLVDERDRQFLVCDALDWLKLAPRSDDSIRGLRGPLRRAAAGRPEEADVAVWEAANPPPSRRFFSLTEELEKCVLDSDFVPSTEWLSLVYEKVETHAGSNHPASVGYALPCLLPLAARSGNPTALPRVRTLIERFLGMPTLTSKNHLGFARACYRYVDKGAWPDREYGERILISLGIKRPPVREDSAGGASSAALFDLEKEAVALAGTAAPLPSPDWLDAALAETAKAIEKGSPKAAGFLFPPLLALAARLGSESSWAQLATQVAALLADPSFGPSGRRKFALACYRYLDDGAWPDRVEAERLLILLGIKRPSPGPAD